MKISIRERTGKTLDEMLSPDEEMQECGEFPEAEQVRELRESYLWRCAYCFGVTDKRGAIDHFVPLSFGGRNDIENLVPCCQSCNSSKHSKNLLVWLAKSGKLRNEGKWKIKTPYQKSNSGTGLALDLKTCSAQMQPSF